MYTIVDKLLARLEPGDGQKIEFSQNDIRIATAVLLYRVIHVDGRVRDAEVLLYRKILDEYLKVSPDEFRLFESIVEDQSNSCESMQPFIQIVRKMPDKNRREILDLMRDISLSDQEFHEFELNLVAKAAELLDIKP